MDQLVSIQVTLAAIVTALVALVSAIINNWQASKTARVLAELNRQQHQQRLEFEKARAENELELGKIRLEFEKNRAVNELAADDRRHQESLESETSNVMMELALKLTLEEFQRRCIEAEKEHEAELDDLKRRGMFDCLMELPRIAYPSINEVFRRNLKLVQKRDA